MIIVPQTPPTQQRALFLAAMEEIGPDNGLINEALEVLIDGDEVILNRYEWPAL